MGGGHPFENRAALLLIVDENEFGDAEAALVQLLLPSPRSGWEERLEAIPCKVVDRRIRPCMVESACVPTEFEWILTDGWWAHLDDAAETEPVHGPVRFPRRDAIAGWSDSAGRHVLVSSRRVLLPPRRRL